MGTQRSQDPADAPAGPAPVGARRFYGRAIGIVVIIGLAAALYQLALVILLIAAAIVVAVCVHLLSDPLRRRLPIGRKASALIALSIIVSIVIGASYFFGVEVSRQAERLFDQLPDSIESLEEQLSDTAVGRAVHNLVQDGEPDPGAIFNYVRGAVGGAFSAAVYLVVTLVAGVIFSLYPEKHRDGLLMLFPADQRPRLREATDICGRAMKGWLVGQLISMLIIAALTSVGLMLIGMPSWLVLGLIAGAAQFVPLLGPFASAIPGLLIAASIDSTMFLSALAVYIGVQQLEGNIITPIVMRKVASLPMTLTLFSILVFGALFGLLGVILATPITVAIYVLVQKLYVEDVLGDKLDILGRR